MQLFAYILKDEITNATQLVGCLTICLAVVIVAWGNNLKEELDHNVKENQIKKKIKIASLIYDLYL